MSVKFHSYAYTAICEKIPELVAKMVDEMEDYYGTEALFGPNVDILQTVIQYDAQGKERAFEKNRLHHWQMEQHVEKAASRSDCTIDINDERVLVVRTLKDGGRYEVTYEPYETKPGQRT